MIIATRIIRTALPGHRDRWSIYSAYPPPVFRDNGDDEIRLADLWRGLVSYRYFIAIVAIASVGISLVFAFP